MKKTDFMTYDEKVKALTEPPKPKTELKLGAKSELAKTPKQNSAEEEPVIDDLYEAYKFEWLIDSSYTIYDLVTAIIDYAKDEKRMAELYTDPVQVVSDWENDRGFGEEIWLGYDEWVAENDPDEYSSGASIKNNSIQEEYDVYSEILGYYDMGYTVEELKKIFNFKEKDIDKAIQYSNFDINIPKQ